MPVRASPIGRSMRLMTLSADLDPCTINKLAGQLGEQVVRGSQKSRAARLWPMFQAYSATTTPTSNRERSRPVGQASPRWASAAP